MYVYVRMCMYGYVWICMYAWMYVHMYACMYVYVCSYTYIYIYMYNTHICLSVSTVYILYACVRMYMQGMYTDTLTYMCNLCVSLLSMLIIKYFIYSLTHM